MARRPLGPIAAAAAFVAVAPSLLWIGQLYRNGDAAVYAWQAENGVLGERVTHVGWIALGALGRPFAGDAATALDVLNLGAAVTVVLGLTAWAIQLGHRLPDDAFPGTGPLDRMGVDLVRLAVPVVVAAAVVPWALGAEVDLPWMALVVGAVIVRWPGVSGVLAAGAVAVSPTALLALPVALLARRLAGRPGWWAVAAGAGAAVVALTVGSLGDWLWADRGVLRAPAPRLWRSLIAWGTALQSVGPVAVVAAVATAVRGRQHLVGPGLLAAACLPLLLAPPDVFGWLPALFVVVGLIAQAAPRFGTLEGCGARAFVLVGTVGAVVIAAPLAWDAHREVRLQDGHTQGVARNIGVDDALVTAWTRGVRVSIRKTGHPYAYRWRVPDGFVRDQQARWCALPLPDRVWDWTGAERAVAWRDGFREDCP